MMALWTIVGYVLGVILFGMGIFPSGAGDGTSVFLFFLEPAGLDFVRMPLWWALLFGVAASNLRKRFRWLIVATGESIHFVAATIWITQLSQSDWDRFWILEKKPFVAPLFFIFICTYVLAHLAIFWLCFLDRCKNTKRNGISPVV
jgi:hypothetical protein